MTIRKSPERKRKRSKERQVHHEDMGSMPTMQRQEYGNSDGYAKEEIEKLHKKFDHLSQKVDQIKHHKTEVREVIRETSERHERSVDQNDYEGRIEELEKHCKHMKKDAKENEEKAEKCYHKLEKKITELNIDAPKEKKEKVKDDSGDKD